jgi:hypothetical protein
VNNQKFTYFIKKNWIWLLALAVFLPLFIKLMRWAFKVKPSEEEAQKDKESKEDSAGNVVIKSSLLTITNAEAEQIALSLYDKMKGYGTKDEGGIVNMFNEFTGDDILLVRKYFGVKLYTFMFSSEWLLLEGWIREEFSDYSFLQTTSYFTQLKSAFKRANIEL